MTQPNNEVLTSAKQFIFTDKYLDALSLGLQPQTNLLVFEGTIRSQKTVTAIQTFFEAVQDSQETLHLISAENLDSIRDNILTSDFGLEVMYPTYLERAKEEFGGYYLKCKCDLPGRPPIKKILLCGYATATQWEKINGKTVGAILIDEVNNADPSFVRECFARQSSATKPLQIWTLNGDVPTHYIYTEYINRCRVIYRNTTPASILADMDKFPKEPGWYYMHWTMDDNPIMDKDKIERTHRLYPIGSYYYTIKVLGERGAPGKLLFIDYMNADKIIKPLDTRSYTEFGLGFDIGATKAENSITLLGFRDNYSKVGVIDKMTFKQCGYIQKTQYLLGFIKRYTHLNLRYLSIDSAEQNYIKDIRNLFKQVLPTIDVIGSYKATIKERVDLMIILFSHEQIEFNDTVEGRDAYDAFLVAKKSEKPNEIREDKNERHNDIMDSVEYALTTHMNALLMAAKRYERMVA